MLMKDIPFRGVETHSLIVLGIRITHNTCSKREIRNIVHVNSSYCYQSLFFSNPLQLPPSSPKVVALTCFISILVSTLT